MKLYNTLTRQKEEFIPIEENMVKMYVCGPTVYNYFHIGNARPFIIFDALRKYMEYKGLQVKFVQNFTDVDDKMINTANNAGITIKDVADKYIAEYFKDAEGLGIKKATIHPKATENIGAIIKLVKTLENKGFAYEKNGNVYFSTSEYKDYGKLSNHNPDDLEAGARVDVNEEKNNPMDFLLWKAEKPGEPSWNSPWGKGRPGWHVECSAMAMKYLNESIDIHTGGLDLIFPHHENEIAQSEAATGKKYVNYWLHNGFINVDNEKMSKSLGNFFTVRDVVAKFDYEIIRFFMMTAHYRSPINFSDKLLEQAANGMNRMYECIENLKFAKNNADSETINEVVKTTIDQLKVKFMDALEDDFNTADALAAMFEIVKYANTSIIPENQSKETIAYTLDIFNELANILGILQNQKEEKLPKEVEQLIQKRQQARKNKDFVLADKIRDQIKEYGIELKDTPQGIQWSRI